MAFKDCQRTKSRSCRAYRLRTIEYVHRAAASWRALFGPLEVPSLDGAPSCSDLAKLVKSFLGREVSSSPMEQLSFQSIKKGLPDSCKCMEKGMLDKLAQHIGSSPPPISSAYLRFVTREVRRLFVKGWDSSYEANCLAVSPPLSSVFDRNCLGLRDTLRGTPFCPVGKGGRANGGCLGQLGGLQDQFLDCVLHGHDDMEVDAVGELIVVQSAGKPRPLSKFDASALLLKPLHKTIFGHLKRKKWLLVGDPTREKMKRAGFRQGGGSLVSGDYQSATDNLYVEVAEVILRTLMEESVFLPEVIKKSALEQLRPLLYYGENLDESVRVSMGQMMGSYLSFPLLCLQNYLSFRWSLRGTKDGWKVPVLINGDDILFQKDNHFDRWVSTISSVGLTVERTKTSVEVDWGTINSTLLEWIDGDLQPSWSARFGMFRPAEHPGSLGRSFENFLRNCNDSTLRYRAGREFFKWHCAGLRSAGVSPVSLGFRGLLARRLSGIFGLLELPMVELPRAFDKHAVGYDADFVSRLDVSSLGPEELFQSSLELGSEKWGKGWQPVDLFVEASAYCRGRSAAAGRRYDYPDFPAGLFGGDAEFQFLLRNRYPFRPRVRISSKAFLQPFPPSNEVLVSWTVLSAWVEAHQEQGWLPPYCDEGGGVGGGSGAAWKKTVSG